MRKFQHRQIHRKSITRIASKDKFEKLRFIFPRESEEMKSYLKKILYSLTGERKNISEALSLALCDLGVKQVLD